MANRILRSCPVCGGELLVTRLHCSACDTTVEGHFSHAATPFGMLTAEQTQFLLAFIRCEGRFTRLEQELNLSYPTLRNRQTGLRRPISAMAAFTGMGFDSTKFTFIRGKYFF